ITRSACRPDSRASACCKPPRSARSRASATPSSPAAAGSRRASMTASMAAALGVKPDHLLTAYQIHSPDVVVADQPWTQEKRPHADAIVTRTPRLAIGVSTADCGPLLLADAEAAVIGAAHAGWRGALTGVIEAAIAAMETLGAERS